MKILMEEGDTAEDLLRLADQVNGCMLCCQSYEEGLEELKKAYGSQLCPDVNYIYEEQETAEPAAVA